MVSLVFCNSIDHLTQDVCYDIEHRDKSSQSYVLDVRSVRKAFDCERVSASPTSDVKRDGSHVPASVPK